MHTTIRSERFHPAAHRRSSTAHGSSVTAICRCTERVLLLILTIAVGAASSALVTGCSTTAPVMSGDAAADYRSVRTMVERRNAEVRALTGQGRISIDTPELGNTGGITVRLLKPDSLLVDITGPFGVGVAKGLITSSEFAFYNGTNNTVLVGTTTGAKLRRVLSIPLEFSDVLDALTGTFGFGSAPDSIPSVSVSGDKWVALFTGDDEVLEYTVDLKYRAVTSFIRRSVRGDVIESVRFRDFRTRGGVYLPYVVSVERPAAEESLTLVYDRVTINDLPIDFTFRYPKSATRIPM